MTNDDMIKRVAHAIAEEDFNKHDYKSMAIAAITAMFEPTPEMVKAGTIGWDALDGSGVKPIFDPTAPYRAMIRAALSK